MRGRSLAQLCRIRAPSWDRSAGPGQRLAQGARPAEGLAPSWCCSPGRDCPFPPQGGVQGVRSMQRTLGAGLDANQGCKILAQQPFPYFTVLSQLLLIKHSTVCVWMQRDLSPGTSPPIYYLYEHLTALAYFRITPGSCLQTRISNKNMRDFKRFFFFFTCMRLHGNHPWVRNEGECAVF